MPAATVPLAMEVWAAWAAEAVPLYPRMPDAAAVFAACVAADVPVTGFMTAPEAVLVCAAWKRAAVPVYPRTPDAAAVSAACVGAAVPAIPLETGVMTRGEASFHGTGGPS